MNTLWILALASPRFTPLCLIENMERAKHIFNVYLTPEEKENSSIVVFDLVPSPPRVIIVPDDTV